MGRMPKVASKRGCKSTKCRKVKVRFANGIADFRAN
ncbi:hypothetical protein HMPREF1022_00190 [Desulfovibrio sp. 6_1_46AFAA]|nr:hypothetical protein HMPREF1022_00190 [Desulfovibrio sp. 6_1_46AFAA]